MSQTTLPQLAPIEKLRAMLDQSKAQIAAALPKHLNADRMSRIALTEFRKNPDLMKCEPASLIGAIIQAAQLGLEPGGALGHCYLIPFRNNQKQVFECQFMIGYRGMIDIARRSGVVAKVDARPVYQGDTFEYEYGLNERLVHVPSGGTGPDQLTHVYCIVTLTDGTKSFEVLTREEVERARSRSKAANAGPWKTDFIEMARKTSVRKRFKYMPVSIEMQRAVGFDEQAEADISQDNARVIAVAEEDYQSLGDAPQDAASEPKKEPVRVKGARSKDDVQKATEQAPPADPSEFANFSGGPVGNDL